MKRLLLLATAAAAASLAPMLPATAVAPDDRATWIVSFAEAPLASYRGPAAGDRREKALGLAATSPSVTGADRLDPDNLAARNYRAWLGERRREHLAAAEAVLGRPLAVGRQFEIALHAVTVTLDADEAARLAALPGVRSVERERIIRPLTDAGPGWIGAGQVWSAAPGLATRGEGRVVGVIDTGINLSHPSFAASAIDGYTHSNPRGRLFGLCASTPASCNAKRIGVYDFTVCTGRHASDGCENKEADTGADVDGHGSHVASTAVGNPLDTQVTVGSQSQLVRVSGVAPRASLISYKACEVDQCRLSWVLAAIEQAVADGVDVINYSLGGSAYNPWDGSETLAMLAARDANVMVVAAAGNDGPAAGSLGSPANAPWVLAVANTTHDRAVANRLVELSGGATAPPSAGVLIGASLTGGYGPAPIVVPLDHPGCSIGTDLDSPPSGVSNPWSPGRFSGEIVACMRGTQARVAKSNNVSLAGGGGMLLLNRAEEGESVVADAHGIPSSHLGYTDGSALLAWLGAGSGHRGRIEAARLLHDPSFADRLSSSSSRGPVAAGDFMKPALAAPGSSILAAGPSGTAMRFLSGTSMASPHVAGAYALLKAARPQWTPTEIESALITTADKMIRLPDAGSDASVFDQGGGRVDLAGALKAGLSFPVTRTEFQNANPAFGGRGRGLNQPALVNDACRERCSFGRRVKDIAGGGTWHAEVVAPAGLAVTVSPQVFTLAANAEQALQIEAEFTSGALLGRWVEAAIVLRRDDGSAADVSESRLPVALYSDPGGVPAAIDLAVSAERGFRDVTLQGLVALQDLRIGTTPLAAPQAVEQVLPQDPTRSDIYDNIGSGSFVHVVDVPASAAADYRLEVTTSSPTSPDVDLYVGIDLDGDRLPDADEELCHSGGPDANERCVLELGGSADARSIWVLAQNWQAGVSGNDRVLVETLLVDLAAPSDRSLVVTGPAMTEADAAFALRVSWDEPSLTSSDRRVGYLTLAIGDEPAFASIPVSIRRGGSGAVARRALQSGETLTLALPAGAQHGGLFVDVPGNAGALQMTTRSAGSIELYAIRTDPAEGPTVPAAPSLGTAQASALGAGGNKSLRVDGATLQPGRWYIVPVNRGAAAASIELQTTIEYEAARVPMTPGAYFNPARSGAGAFLYEAGDAWGFIWYTFLQDGSPTWYLGVATAPGPQQGVWTVPLERYVWNGSQARATQVGEALLSFGDSDAFQFTFNLDGETGSERYVRIDTGSCPQVGGQPFDASGMWYPPSRPGIGYSINVGAGIESVAAYLYDADGVARWLFGHTSPFGADSFPLSLFEGFCPLCPYEPPNTVEVGTFQRAYADSASGTIGVQYALPAPLAGQWSFMLPSARLTDPAGCP